LPRCATSEILVDISLRGSYASSICGEKRVFDEKEVNTLAYVISDECTACGSCMDECPVEAISEGDIYVIDPELCTDCGACEAVCPVEAISSGD